MTSELGFVAAFMVGLLGSVHCIGMCGGIVGLIGAQSPKSEAAFGARLVIALGYNAGRILSYGIAGFIAGAVGSGAYDLFPVSRVANVGMLLSGAFMVLLGLYLAGWWGGLARIEHVGGVFWSRIRPLTRFLVPVRTPPQAVLLGMLWGWLPCGLVYATLVWALFAADPYYSSLIMIVFGLGTLPMLLAMGAAAERLSELRSRPVVRRVAGLLIIGFGALTFLGVVHPLAPVGHPVPGLCTG